MKKSNKKIITIVCICLLIIVGLVICFPPSFTMILFGLSSCNFNNGPGSKESAVNTIKINTEVVLPEKIDLIERFKSHVFMHGSIPYYYIIQFEEEPTEFLKDYDFSEKKDESLEKKITEELVFTNSGYNMYIPKEYLDIWNGDYLIYYRMDCWYFIYFIDTCELRVFICAN